MTTPADAHDAGSRRVRIIQILDDATRRGESNATRLGISIAVSIGAIAIQEPRGWTGLGLASMVLVIANAVLLLARHLPDAAVPSKVRTVLLYVTVALAAASINVSTGGMSVTFGFYAAGHAGFRLRFGRAIALAAACSAVCTIAALFPAGGHLYYPWYVAAATGLSVLLGMVNRSRRDALTSAVAAADASDRARLAAEQARESAERAAQAEARETVLAERGRIARDVHDVLAHSLAGINMQLEMADALMDAGRTEQAREATKRAQSLVRESLVEAQRTVRALREDALPLVETIRAMAETTAAGTVPEIVGEVREVDTRTAQALVRVAQEALTNAHKHAPGAPLSVRVVFEPGSVVLEVQNEAPVSDDRPLTDLGSGMGLVGMRERMALIGGTIEMGPTAEGGWHVRATAPTS